jgi:hypothetical protein
MRVLLRSFLGFSQRFISLIVLLFIHGECFSELYIEFESLPCGVVGERAERREEEQLRLEAAKERGG